MMPPWAILCAEKSNARSVEQFRGAERFGVVSGSLKDSDDTGYQVTQTPLEISHQGIPVSHRGNREGQALSGVDQNRPLRKSWSLCEGPAVQLLNMGSAK
jgi:hypothetical protein